MTDRPRRATATGLLRQFAYCPMCGWELESRNAQGVAAQHHDRTGHRVHVEVTRIVIYGKRPGDEIVPSGTGGG